MKCFRLHGFDNFKSDFRKISEKTDFNTKLIVKTIYKNQYDSDSGYHVDGDLLQKLCFPTDKKYDVFISHSHLDVELAENIVIELEQKYNVKCFIDSRVWQFYEDIEKELSNLFSEKDLDGIKIDIYMLLTEALFRVIINTEHFFFLETENSINYLGKYITYSPWLFLELSLAKQFNKKALKKIALLENKEKGKDFLKVDFRAIIEDFSVLTKSELFDISSDLELIRQINKRSAFENIIYQILKKKEY